MQPLPGFTLADWLRLALAPGIGPVTLHALLRAFGSPAAVLAQPPSALAAVGGRAAAALATPDPSREDDVTRSLEWADRPGHHLLALGSPGYPRWLERMPDPPGLLWVRGDPDRLGLPAVAVVGSRHATAGGRDTAHAFGQALADAGLVVVSGLARGIDAAAHAGALRGAAGTVAVLGTGIDRVYPAEHALLADRIADHGALVTESPLGAPPVAGRFPQRNRIIAALSRGVLVVEAARSSGSLITARLAGDLGREVMAIPGSIHSPLAKGCNALLRDGAALVETVDDVLAALGLVPAQRAAGPGGGDAAEGGPDAAPDDLLLAAMGFDPVDPDRLAEATGLGAGELAGQLSLMELDGRLERLPDGRCLRRR